MLLTTWMLAGARASVMTAVMAAASLLTLHAAADPARLDGIQIAGHDAVDPAVRRFTAKVTRVGQASKAGRISTLRFEPIGPGMVAPKRNELRGWRLTFIRGKMFGKTLWLKSNTPDELTVRNTDPSMEGVTEGDIVVIELIDPKVVDANA
ncbi:hypothetical protein [Variovorax sp. 770b2]|uniref:hypothetical protein n=1 Tax=Variovorax sp. 770b2 TaxID=1566271 RepID=UPI0008EA8CE2|nr:hypothetical protein [Variovorax sp. 770b2]SFP24340.1 hypothetical protein SAMN03159339_1177 [Variovorax sp. 770b2]